MPAKKGDPRKQALTAEEIEAVGNQLVEAGRDIQAVAKQMVRESIADLQPQGLRGVEQGIAYAHKFLGYCDQELRAARFNNR